MSVTADLMKLWFWPWEAVRASTRVMETAAAAHAVLGARLPMISEAFAEPATADYEELALMVSEKVVAFGGSQRTFAAAGRTMRGMANANAAALGRVAGGDILSPMDWMAVFERNVALAATLVTLPMQTMAPIHKRATANARRLRTR